MNLQIQSTGSKNTEQIAAKLGKNLVGSEVIELASDLGGGKTTFTRGLVKGTGSPDHVSSPTFTISKVYNSPKNTIHHFDFYRLEDAGIIKHEILELLEESKNIIVIEWAGLISDILPEKKIKILIEVTGEDKRNFTIIYPAALAYALKGVN